MLVKKQAGNDSGKRRGLEWGMKRGPTANRKHSNHLHSVVFVQIGTIFKKGNQIFPLF